MQGVCEDDEPMRAPAGRRLVVVARGEPLDRLRELAAERGALVSGAKQPCSTPHEPMATTATVGSARCGIVRYITT